MRELPHLVRGAGALVADGGAGEREEGVFERSVLGLLLKSAGVPWATMLAVVDDADAMGDAVGLVHVVRGEKDGDALGLVEVLDVRPELVAALGIEAERGLVEEENFRSVQEAARDFEPALHAAGELLHLVVAAIPELEELEQFFGALGAELVRHMVEDAVEFHVFPGGEFAVEAGVLEDDAEALARFVLMTCGSRPSSSMVPLVGRSSVVSILMVVVLPAPLGPRKAKISPAATSKETSLTAVNSKVFTRFWTLITVSDLP